jgi:hypothetical protein
LILIAFTVLAMAACGPSSAPGSIPGTGDTPAASAVQHQLIPAALPQERSAHAGDQDSSGMAGQKRAPGGDRFTFDQFERPFNADTMEVYFPYLDIQDVVIYQDDTWVYAAITVKGTDSNGALPGNYAVELDLNADGRGDWFVLVEHPASTEWSTDGVQVRTDANGDVGGSTVGSSDQAVSGGDGYETLVFAQDHQSDPDAAWARISPDDPHTIQLAGKRSLLGGDAAYLAGLWTGNEDLNPALFDLNDHFTHEQAGAALTELQYFYPIKQVSELDNTCRMAVGFVPTGNEPGLCAEAGACRPPAGGCAQNGYKWNSKLCCCSWQGTYSCNYLP